MIGIGRRYTYRRSAAHSTAITILQLQAAAARPLIILRAWCNQQTSTTSAQAAIQIVRKTAAATVTAAVAADIVKHDPGDAAHSLQLGTTGTGHTATAEGTDGDVLIAEGFNVLNGWLYLPVPEERIIVPGGGIIALKFPIAPANVTYQYGVTFTEFC